VPASRLLAEFKTLVEEVSKNSGAALERDAAIALRRIEHAANVMAGAVAGGNEFQQLLLRVLTPPPGSEGETPPTQPDAASPLILP
jgi:hypothetical protein